MRIVRLLSIRRPEDRQWRHRLYLPDVDIGSAEIGDQENHAAILYFLAKPLTAENAEDAEEIQEQYLNRRRAKTPSNVRTERNVPF